MNSGFCIKFSSHLKLFRLFVLAFSLFTSQNLTAQKAFFEYGYPLSLNDFKGVGFLGFGKTIIGSNSLSNAYVKPECSLYRFERSNYFNLEFHLGGRILLANLIPTRVPFIFWALGEGGYGKMMGEHIENDNAFLYSVGIGFTYAAMEGTIIFIMYQGQSHNNAFFREMHMNESFDFIKFGVQTAPFSWW